MFIIVFPFFKNLILVEVDLLSRKYTICSVLEGGICQL